jgi:phosphatidylinositol alpha-1,6-mannosyltransferase
VDTLLLAWLHVLRHAPDAELTVIGDGDDRARLERRAERLGVASRVRFRGRVSDAELRDAYAQARVFALPGRARLGAHAEGEGFGLVFLEAAAAGLPSVAGRAGGAVEAVEDGVTGILVDPNSPQAVARAIVSILREPDLARSMGEAGRRRVEREFSGERFRGRIGALIAELTGH